jgi:hypothetical protein
MSSNSAKVHCHAQLVNFQTNPYLINIDDCLPRLPRGKPIHIVLPLEEAFLLIPIIGLN